MSNQPEDFALAFAALPGNFLLLAPDAPHYTILAISDELLHITNGERVHVVGRSVFDAYPENLAARSATGPARLRDSLDNTLRTKQPDHMPLVRYDVAGADGAFEPRYWSAHTKAVLDSAGQVQHLIHSTEDVTARVQAANSTTEQKTFTETLQQSEQRFRIMTNAAPNLVWAVNPDASIRFHHHTTASGVGLYLLNRIVQTYDGRLEVDSQEEGAFAHNFVHPCGSGLRTS